MFHEMVPLAWAVRCAGHEVRVCGPARMGEPIIDAGLPAVLVDGSDGALLDGALLDGILDFADRWRADLVVGPGADRPGALAVSRSGADPLVLDPVPRSLRGIDGGSVAVRHVPYHGPALVGEALRRPPRQPWTCVTSAAGDGLPIPELFDLVGEFDLDVVAAVDADLVPAGISIPDNLRLFDRCMLPTLLPHAAAIVHGGDIGAVLTAIAFGVPQIAVAGDDVGLAGLVAGFGAGVLAGDAEDALERAAAVTADHHLRRSTERLRGELRSAPPPHELVGALARFATN